MGKKTLNIVGIILIVIGAVLVMTSVFGTLQQSSLILNIPDVGSIEAEDIPAISVTMIIAGAVLIVLGILSLYISSKIKR